MISDEFLDEINVDTALIDASEHEFSGTIERALGMEAKKNFLPMQAGDVPATYADVADLARDTGFAPKTPLADGIERWAAWFRAYVSG